MFSKKFDRRIYLFLIFVFGSGAVGMTFGFYALWPANVEKGYKPEQPIEFSHALHAGDGILPDGRRGMNIECIYCHSNVETSAHATVPPTSTCMKCHSQVPARLPDGSLNDAAYKTRPQGMAAFAELKKLIEDYHGAGKPVEWVKVNDVADFVYFNHSRHIAAGLDCTECHGDVGTMDRVERVHSLKMAWCLDCHMQEPTETTTEQYKELELRGPIHCSACHR